MRLPKVVVRRAAPRDIPAVLALEEACYPTLSTVARWTAVLLENHQRRFPEGQLLADTERRIVGYSATFRTRSEAALRPHTFGAITGRGTFDTHEPAGDVLYGAEIMVHPDARRRGIARKLYDARLALARELGVRYFVAGGRIPGYEEVASTMDAHEYVRQVVRGEREDRVLTSQLRNHLTVRDVMPNYLNDRRSGGYATLLVWENPDVRTAGAAGRPSKGRGEERRPAPVKRRASSSARDGAPRRTLSPG